MKYGFLFIPIQFEISMNLTLLLLKGRELTGFKSKCGDTLNIEGG
jgi:hypothetical protein